MRDVLTRGIRAYVSRDWEAARHSKDDYWGERVARLGPGEGVRVADDLRRQARVLDPAWPRPDDRQQDLISHVRVAALFRASATGRS